MPKALRWQDLVSDRRLAAGVAALAGIIYLFQSWVYAHTQFSMLDEGAYLVDGYLFATGRYRPFQDYGIWTNQMPLSFLIPGYVQVLFGPGLRSGRYFAILLGALILLGLWVTARRLGGRWWAAGAVLAVALNPAVVKMYSVATSQGLVACMLVWALAFTLGENRPLWQIILGVAIAGGVALARINLIPVLPLLLIYIFWQHSRRVGLWATLAGGAVVLGGHALFWPGILRMWAAWVPAGLVPFLAPWRPPAGTPVWNPTAGLESRVLSLLFGARYHFVAVVGVLAVLLLWPRRGEWKLDSQFRASLLLVSLFGVLFVAHAWASLGINAQTYDALGKNYCVFCFPLYLAFFSTLGVLLLAASASSWCKQMSGWQQVATAVLILVLAIGLGYSAFDPVGDVWLDWRVPRLKTFFTTGQLLPGYVPLWEFLRNKLNLTFNQTRRLLPTLAGLGVGMLVLGVTEGVRRMAARRYGVAGWGFGSLALVVFLIVGLALSPSLALGAGYQNYDCGGDVIANYEEVGVHLAARIPPDSRVYWQGGLSPAPLLYIPLTKIYPPQMNDGYTFRLGGNSDNLRKYGLWNQELAEQWLADADFALVEERFYEGWLKDALLDPDKFEYLGQSPPTVSCREDARIHIFRRLP